LPHTPIFLWPALRFLKQRLEKVPSGLLGKTGSPLMIMFRTIGLTFDQIAQAIGRDEIWVAAAFYGQVEIG